MQIVYVTETGRSPSAKMYALNEVMLVFSAAPRRYRRILFVLKHMRKDVSLASHYVGRFGHLIGPNVEILGGRYGYQEGSVRVRKHSRSGQGKRPRLGDSKRRWSARALYPSSDSPREI